MAITASNGWRNGWRRGRVEAKPPGQTSAYWEAAVRAFKWIALAVVASVLLFVGYLAYRLVPQNDPRPLPAALIAADTEAGALILRNASSTEDYEEISRNFEPQKLTSFCGVASSVITLNALDRKVTQSSLFNDQASRIRPIWQVAVRGMTIDTLAGILEANEVKVEVHRPVPGGLLTFRAAVERNLASDNDYLLVNYQRQVLGQDPIGHISPLAAYDRQSDRVLIMDTADYKYPPAWVPLPALYDAMAAVDPETGRPRGWVEVSDY
jgi:Phytochelatin synthase